MPFGEIIADVGPNLRLGQKCLLPENCLKRLERIAGPREKWFKELARGSQAALLDIKEQKKRVMDRVRQKFSNPVYGMRQKKKGG